MLHFWWWPELTEALYWQHNYLFSLRLLPTLPDGPSCPQKISGVKRSPGWKNLPRVEKAISRGSSSSNRLSYSGETQSQITDRLQREVPCAGNYFSLLFQIEKQHENRNSASEKPTQTTKIFLQSIQLVQISTVCQCLNTPIKRYYFVY